MRNDRPKLKTTCGMLLPLDFLFARKNGFTLIELAVTLTVAGILAAIAMPAYKQFVESGRLTTATNDLIADLTYARIEAMKRGSVTQMGICASADGTSCAALPTTWRSGWVVFIDAYNTGYGAYQTSDTITVLKVHEALPSSLAADSTPISGTNTLIFNYIGAVTGYVGATPTALSSLQISDSAISQSRVICLNGGTGRVMLAANNNVSSCQ